MDKYKLILICKVWESGLWVKNSFYDMMRVIDITRIYGFVWNPLESDVFIDSILELKNEELFNMLNKIYILYCKLIEFRNQECV